MAELSPGPHCLGQTYWKTEKEELSFDEIIAESIALEVHFAGLKERSLVVLEGFSPQTAWCLMLAAWRRDLSVLPVAQGQTVDQLPWTRLLRPSPPGIEWVQGTHEYSHACDLYILTSGSTGHPKAIGHELTGLIASARATLEFYRFELGDSWLLSLDHSHIGGFQILLRSWLAAGVVSYAGGPRDVGIGIEKLKPQFLSLVPTQLVLLLEDGDITGQLRKAKVIMLGGAATQASLLSQLKDSGLPISITYGSSETASQISGFTPGTFPSDNRDVGRILPVWSVTEENGELFISGQPLFKGYFQNQIWHPVPERFRLPDRGRRQDDSLWIEGRHDQIFQVGGENVSPADIVQVLESSETLAHLLVLKKPDPRFGHVPLLVVRSRTRPKVERILSHLEKLKPMFRPREIWWFESDDIGKISQSQLEPLVLANQPPLHRLWTYEKL